MIWASRLSTIEGTPDQRPGAFLSYYPTRRPHDIAQQGPCGFNMWHLLRSHVVQQAIHHHFSSKHGRLFRSITVIDVNRCVLEECTLCRSREEQIMTSHECNKAERKMTRMLEPWLHHPRHVISCYAAPITESSALSSLRQLRVGPALARLGMCRSGHQC